MTRRRRRIAPGVWGAVVALGVRIAHAQSAPPRPVAPERADDAATDDRVRAMGPAGSHAGGVLDAPAARAASASTEPLLHGRDLESFLSALPVGAPLNPLSVGPGLAGLGQGEIAATLDGIDITDPLDGGAPLELPLVLFGRVRASAGAAGVDDAAEPVDGAGPGLHLQSSHSAGPVDRRFARWGGSLSAAPRGDESAGARPAGLMEIGASDSFALGRLRVGLVAAPRVRARTIDADSFGVPAFRSRDVIPALARVEGQLRGWSLSAVGLSSFVEEGVDYGARIVPVGAEDYRRRLFNVLGIEARHGVGRWVLGVGASALDARAQIHPLEGDVAVRSGQRFSAHATIDGTVGSHSLRFIAGVDRTQARRHYLYGFEPRPTENDAVAEAAADTPYVAADERFRPRPWLELGAGLRVEGMLASRAPSPEVGVTRSVVFNSRPLLAPRAHVAIINEKTGSGLRVGIARFGRRLPLAGVLTATDAPATSLALPAFDQIEMGGEARGHGGFASLFAVARWDASVVEDRASPQSGQLALYNPDDAHRRYRALVAQAGLVSSTTAVRASYALASLDGTYSGAADTPAGRTQLGATAQFDAPDLGANRDGALSLDRRHAVRVSLVRWASVGRVGVEGSLAARLDSGVPVDALGRSAQAGPAQVFLVPRGSYDRTGLEGSLDLALTVTRPWRQFRLRVGVEAFNVTNQRPVIAVNPVFTDSVLTPRPGGSRARLGELVGPNGQTVAQNPAFLAPVAYAEPFLARLVVGLEL